MTVCDSQPDNTSLFHPDKFRMVINKLPNVTYFLQRAQIPGMTVVEADFNTRFINAYRAGDTMLYDELTVEFLVDEDLANWIEVYNWMKLAGMPEEPLPEDKTEADLYSDLTIQLLTNNNALNRTAIFKCAFPTNLGSIELDSSVSEATEVVVPVTFRYTSFEFITDDGGTCPVE